MLELLKAVLKTGSGSGASLLLGMITMKVMAIVLGPAGLGLYSLLRQTMDFSNRLGTLGGGTALVQGIASRKGQARDDYLVTTFWVFVLGTLLIVVVLLVFATWIALWVFDSTDGQTTDLVRWLVLPVALGVASIYLTGVLNGFRAIGLLALLQILGAAATALLVYPASRLVEAGHPIAFIAVMSAAPAVGVALGTWSAVRAGWLAPLLHRLRIRLHSDSLRHFFSFAGILLVTDLAIAGTVLAVRSFIVRYDGFASAGIFAAAWSLSMTYITLALSSFGTYYLPTLSQTDNPLDRIVLMQRVVRFATIAMVPLITAVIVLKPLAIEVLYSSEFASSLEIIRWMLIGDYFKAAAWVFSIPMLAYVDVKAFFWAEVLWSVGFLSFAAVSLFGFGNIQGLGIGFLVIYAVYLVYCLQYARSRHRFPLTRRTVVPWVLGLALIVGASWHTWADIQVNWLAVPLWMGAAVSFSWLSLNRDERRKLIRLALRQEVQP